MKKIVLVLIFLLATSSLFAQGKPVALIYGSETQGTDIVDSILVQLNATITTPEPTWADVIGDFSILDGITVIPVISANTGAATGDNYFILKFDTALFPFPPDKNDLKLDYVQGATPIPTEYGNLQSTLTPVDISDGIAPRLITYSITSSNANPYLGEVGDTVTFTFVSNEALATTPVAPQVTFTVPGTKATETVTAIMDSINQKYWHADYTIPANPNLNGRITCSATFTDVNDNDGSLDPAVDEGTDGTYVTVKNYLPTYTYVGAGFDATHLPAANVSGDTDDLIYLWNVFKTVQEGIDAVATNGYVNVTTGTYAEDLTIATTLELLPYEAPPTKAYDVVTLKGVATGNVWPNAYPNIDILATGVSIHNFKIEAPDYVVGFYSSGIVVGATNATIYNNAFYANYVNSTDDISQSIQTYNTVDISGLDIYTNTFNNVMDKIAFWGYEGIYINPGGTGHVNIEDNTFNDACFRAITTQRSNVTIDGNNINTNQAPVPDDWSNPGAWVGIWAYDDISDIVITGNTVQGTVGGTGFNRGIRLGSGSGSTFTNLSVTSNEIYYNKNGIYSQSAAGITITGNAIKNNTAFGIFCDTGTLNAENNWWGSANGPDHVDNTFYVGSQGDVSSDYVDYVPWFDFDMAGASFAPVHSDDGVVKAITYFSSIQTALDAAAAGATLTCQAGTFDEQFNVEVSNLTLKGISNTTTIVQPSAAPAVGVSDVAIGLFGGSNVDHVIIKDILFDFNGADGLRHGQGIVVSDLNGPAVEDVVIEYCNIYCGLELATPEPKCGIQSGKNADLDGLIIRYNGFYGSDGTYGSYGVYINPNSGTGIITVTNNNFYGKQYAGVSVESNKVDVFYNTINPTLGGTYGIRVIDFVGGVNYNDIAIGWNDIDNVTYGVSVGMSSSSGSTLAANIGHNTINNCDVGIRVREDADLSVNGEVHYNDLSGNTSFGIKVESTSNVNAEDNWWGSSDGPIHVNNTFNIGSQGVVVTDLVDYVPWYNTDMTGISFAPVELWESSVKLDKNKLREENLSFKDVSKNGFEQFSSIQTAIDAYDDVTYDWAGIGCYAGTFTEDFVANKDDIWFEAEYTKQLVTLLGDQEVTGNYVWFDDFEFDPQAGVALLLNSSAAPIDGTWIDGCTFTIDESGDVGIYLGGSASPNAVTYTDIENSIFNGPTNMNSNPFKVGGWFGTNIGCEIDGLDFYNNEVNKGSIPINLVDADINDIWIYENDFLDTDGVIYFWNSPASSPTGVLDYFVFENNYVPSSNSYGIAIGGASLGGPTFTDANFGANNQINENAFEMSGTTYGYGAVYMADQYTGLLDASNNWWGDAYGPENDNNTYTPPAPPKGRATVSDRVEFAPWYNDGTNAATGRGWYPAGGTTLFAPVINVTDDPDTYHSSIQRAINAASPNDVLTCIAGTFTEDVVIDKTLEIRPNGTAKAYDDVTIKGVRTEPVANWPLATENIDIATNGVKIHHFTIESPTIADGYYSSGIVLNGIDIEIYDNDFVIDGTSTHDSRAVCIQTRRIDVFPTACVDGLLIQDNTFGGVIGTRGYYGIYINRDNNAGTVTITENELTGRMRAGIANERSNVVISNNLFDGGGAAWTGENINGMWIIDWDITRTIDNVDITGNTISNFASDGIELGWKAAGPTYQTLTDVVVSYNTITGNDKGIKVASGADGISVNYNNISGNTTYGVENTHTASLDATKNWWGDATGPDDDGDTNPHTTPLGDKVSTDVIFIPWYATSTVTPTTEYVRTHETPVPKVSFDLAFADAIQPGIDAAAGDYYYVEVSDKGAKISVPYTENLTVDHEAYIYKETVKASPPVTIIGTHVITGDNVTFDGFTLTPGASVPGTVITINSTSQEIDNTMIRECQFNIQASPSVGIYVGGGTPTNKVEDTEIRYCTFNGPADMLSNPFKVGGSFSSPIGCEIDYLYFTNNYVNYGSIPINLADKNIVGLRLEYNDFANTDGVIYFWAEDVAKSPTGEISLFGFTNNYVGSTNSYGVGFDVSGNFTSANYGSDIYINGNYFDAAIPGLVVPAGRFDAVSILTPTVDLAGYVLEAPSNWWGSVDGPTHSSNTFNVPTQGVAVSDNVDFVRWYDSGAGYADPGWVPTGNLFAPVRVGDPKAKAHPYYASIQSAIDGASSSSDIICSGGTFYEDFSVPASKTGLDISPNVMKAYEAVTIKGQATGNVWPTAYPNIEILGSCTSLHHFTIEAPDYVVGCYSSGIVVGATIVEIKYNTFINNAVANTADISQSIQTYLGVDCSNLDIVENTFTDNVVKTSDWGYEGIYINPGCGSSYIESNIFLGMCLRAITLENTGGPSNIWFNDIQTSMAPVPDSWATPGAYQGINLQGDLSNIDVYDNYIGGNNPATGFAQGIRLGSDGDTFIGVDICGNEISYNSYGVLCKSATGVAINHNIIDGNAFGVQNDDTTVKTLLNATHNYWGAIDGPSFTFDYGMGSGSGDLVSEYVDFYPWYEDPGLTTLYDLIMDQFLLEINPTSPYVDNYFDLRVCAADAAGIRDFSYGNLADFSSSHVALSVPEEQLLVDGFKEIVGGCISAQPFEASGHLTIYSWEYSTQATYYSSLTDIVIQAEAAPAPPTAVSTSDVPNDNGGWIYIDYTMSVDDPFYITPPKAAGVSYYIVQKSVYAVPSADTIWIYLTNIFPFDDGSGLNTRRKLLNAPASDSTYAYRMASVHNPSSKADFGDDHISYEPILMGKDGSQSVWVDGGSAAAADNLPAYADFTVFLEGPYNVTNHNMDALNSFIPLDSPYDGETVTSLPAGTVDWLQIQLRTTATGATEKTANAFLLEDGSIVDVSGNSGLPFYYTTGINYYIVISHRNHLDIMTATGNTFGDFDDQATVINLSVTGSVYGNGFKEVETDVYAMYAGDSNDNGQVQNDDLYDYWSNQVGQGGYLEADFNLNGQVQNDDRYDFWKYNVGHGSSVPGGAKGSGDNGNSSQGEKSIGITFTFANGLLSGGYYEFDVMVAGSAEGTKLGSNQTYINYSTAGFGENINTNGKITVTKGSLIVQEAWPGQELYEITNVVDNTSSRVAITITLLYASFPSASDLLTTPSQLLHIKIEIANPAATSDLCFEQSLMATQQYESDNSTKYDPINVGPCLIQTLPVELSSFTAIYNVGYDNIILKWTTASETDVMGFNIYRSKCDDISTTGNHINYSLISLPETGTTTNPIDYSYEDIVANVYSPYYYWLEVVDYGGTSSFHGSIVYTPGDITGDNTPNVYAATKLIRAYPNPAHNYTTIEYQLRGSVLEQNATIKVYNILGKCVKTVEGRIGKVEFDVSDLGSGIYFYQLQTSNYNVVKKLIVIR